MSILSELLATPPDLPVARYIPEVERALGRGSVVIQAPPGTGKTTLIPPVVAHFLASSGRTGRVVVTQPRRVAARAAARRIAALVGEEIGTHIGFTVRGDSRVSPSTLIEFVTPGILVSRFQRDPELSGVDAIILDEVHERHLDSDLAMALAADVRDSLREDLLLVAMSATVEAERTAHLLGGDVVDIPSPLHPLTYRWAPPPRGAEPLGSISSHGTIGVRREFLHHVTATIKRALQDDDGDILAFLPGVREVTAVAGALSGCAADVLPLHGSLAPAEQDRIFSPAGRRVIVSTAIAESSLTVPGVRIVVDAGLSRLPQIDYGRGIGGLVTVRESQAAGIQRAGRAGRLGPGVVYRCFDETTWARLSAQAEPEIRTADLTNLMLQAAWWGAPECAGLALLDRPPAPAVGAATATLHALGALAPQGTLTALGKEMARLPLDPRLARALIQASALIGARRSADICALIDEDLRIPGADLARGWRVSSQWKTQAQRLINLVRTLPDTLGAPSIPLPATPDDETALVVSLAYPERIARLRSAGSRRYVLAHGIGASLPEDSPLIGREWLAIAHLDRAQGNADALIRAATPIALDAALAAAAPLLAETTQFSMAAGLLRATTTRRLGAIELSSSRDKHIPIDAARAWIAGELRAGRIAFDWTPGALALRSRLAFLHRECGDPWPDVSDQALAECTEVWAGPELDALARGKALAPVSTHAMERLFPWPEALALNELAPADIALPGGRRVPVDYSGDFPIARLRLQDAFGWAETPRIAGGRVPVSLELLSPARRPLALTHDLASFWAGPYRQVRAEMRGRYVKHAWPEDPMNPEGT